MKDKIIERINNLIWNVDENTQNEIIDLIAFACEFLENQGEKSLSREQVIEEIIRAFYESRE